MPVNSRKVIRILYEELGDIEERCEGYREELIETLAEIIEAERQHQVRGTNIQKQVESKCNAVGEFLARSRSTSKETKGGTSK